jgi:hypothetical protein
MVTPTASNCPRRWRRPATALVGCPHSGQKWAGPTGSGWPQAAQYTSDLPSLDSTCASCVSSLTAAAPGRQSLHPASALQGISAPVRPTSRAERACRMRPQRPPALLGPATTALGMQQRGCWLRVAVKRSALRRPDECPAHAAAACWSSSARIGVPPPARRREPAPVEDRFHWPWESPNHGPATHRCRSVPCPIRATPATMRPMQMIKMGGARGSPPACSTCRCRVMEG